MADVSRPPRDREVDWSHVRAELVNALRLMSLPAEDQVRALPPFVVVPDEVALVFDDSFRVVDAREDRGGLNPDQLQALRAVDAHTAAMTDAADADRLWTIEAMASDPRWTELRRLAVAALVALGVPLGGSNLRIGAYVAGSPAPSEHLDRRPS